jgi:Leucine-rich repeat (LRR) protein
LSQNQLESIEPFIRLAPQISELILDSNKISSVGMYETAYLFGFFDAALGIRSWIQKRSDHFFNWSYPDPKLDLLLMQCYAQVVNILHTYLLESLENA